MIRIDREKNIIILSRCDYFYSNGKRDEEKFKALGKNDGDIIIPLPDYFKDTTNDPTSDGFATEKIIKEIRKNHA